MLKNDDDSDIQYLNELDKLENKMYNLKKNNEGNESTDESVIMTPLNKKRKNPFVKDENVANEEDDLEKYTKSKVPAKSIEDTDDEVLEIPSFQKNVLAVKTNDPKKKTTSLSDLFESSHDEENMPTDINLVKPIKNMPLKQQHTAKASTNRLIKMNSFALGDLKNASKSSSLNDSVEIKPLTNTGYYFQYDGLGGRKKVPAKSENLKSSLFASSSSSKMQKFTRSKVT
jgi:hypothetical protein